MKEDQDEVNDIGFTNIISVVLEGLPCPPFHHELTENEYSMFAEYCYTSVIRRNTISAGDKFIREMKLGIPSNMLESTTKEKIAFDMINCILLSQREDFKLISVSMC